MRFDLRKMFVLCLILGWPLAHALAFQARLRLLLPVALETSVAGFGDAEPDSSGVGLAVVTPLTKDFTLGLGYSYYAFFVEEVETVSSAGANVHVVNRGIFQNHLFEISGDYLAFKYQAMPLIASMGVELPVAGSGTVSSKTTTLTGQGTSTETEKDSASSVTGWGLLVAGGIVYGETWEFLLFHQLRTLAYDVKITRPNGKEEDVVLNTRATGIGIGYLF